MEMKVFSRAILTSLIVTSIVFSTACSHQQKEFESEITAGRCEDALDRIPENDPMIKLANRTEQATGTIVSYAFAGMNYSAEVLWDVAGGTVMFVALCAPTIAALALHNGPVFGNANCFPGDIGALGAPPLGRKSLEDTKHLRCPDLTGLSRSLRRVSTCYASRGGPVNLKKASDNLESLQRSSEFYSCLPEAEQTLVKNELAKIQALLGQPNNTASNE
ncbi:MAG: hypothetical protein V4692_05495 [Bdellovibrionota bacterium]